MHEAISTAMNDVFIPRVEMAVRLNTGSSRNAPNSLVQNIDRRYFTGNTEENPLSSASSRLVLNNEQDGIDESHHIDNSEDGAFPATKLNFDWIAHGRHNHIKEQNTNIS